MQVFSAIIEFDSETGFYVGIIPEVPDAHSQGATLDELQHNLKEVLALCLMEEFQREDIAWAVQMRRTPNE
jgi:predicted RNase H-like HicB family nuclease